MVERTPDGMVLTKEDIKAIVAEMRAQGVVHICRYDIEPADMKKLIEFVRAFYETSIETRKTFRTMVIRALVWGSIVGFLLWLADKVGWLKPTIEALIGRGPGT